MIQNIITLTKESEYTSREIVAEKRKGDMLLYDVSIHGTHVISRISNLGSTP